ncbi:MAG TPA: 5-formyltetrahydrofolate cyclo-ligase, partial [Gammaproteobacteria bacterium]|nr:5-formyltetrahydrofolate cyclo-ligase [Gammaproteobacteria bacterium]
MQDPQALRRQLKQLRSSLSARARSDAEALVIHQLLHQPRFLRARRVAGYFGRNGEIDPMPLLARAAAMHKHCYLPVLHPFRAGSLWFCRWHPGERLRLNRYGIPEPVPSAGAMIPARWLDVVVVPLLGFDSDCHRLGMGGGYYDRTFSFARRHRLASRPYLIGVAHEVQRVDALPIRPWDVQLDSV